MKIGIDARMLGKKQTGIGLYIENLIKNLAELDSENEYVLFLKKDKFDNFNLPANNFKKVLADSAWYSFSEQTLFLFKLYKENLDLMHFPSFNAPLFYFKKRVTTIHDLTPKYFPGHKMGSFHRKLASCLVFLFSIVFSRKIIAVSEYTKSEILKFYKINSEKIKVIYEGIPNKKKKENSDFQKKLFLEKYKLKKPYIFYTGVWRNHKNLVGLIRAFGILKKRYKKDFLLVLGGKEDPFYPEVRKTWEELSLKNDIITPGFIKDEEMPLFLDCAKLFVLPSFLEGFGFGPLEALSFDTPVAVSKRGAMPEVLGNSAIYFNPEDENDMAKKINEILDNDEKRNNFIKIGKALLGKYNWQDCAKKTLDVYKKAFE